MCRVLFERFSHCKLVSFRVHSQHGTSSRDFELFDVLPCSSSPNNGFSLGSISVSLHASDIIFAVRSHKLLYRNTIIETHTVLNIKFTTVRTRRW